jgi:hypothetical protein
VNYHVNSYYPGTQMLATAEAFPSAEAAEKNKRENDALDTVFAQTQTHEYEQQLHDSLMDVDSTDDTLPHAPKIIRYLRKVEPCKNKKNCVACYEAGFIN